MSNEPTRFGFACRLTTLGPYPQTFRWSGGPLPAYDETGARYEPLISNDPQPSAGLASAMRPTVVIDSVTVEVVHRHGEFYNFESNGGLWSQATLELFWTADEAFNTVTDLEFLGYTDEEDPDLDDDQLVLKAYDPRKIYLQSVFPRRTITGPPSGDFTQDGGPSENALGRILPMFFGGNMFRGIRYCEAHCIAVGEPGVIGINPGGGTPVPRYKFFDTRDATGANIMRVGSVNDQNNTCNRGFLLGNSSASNNSRAWLLDGDQASEIGYNEKCANVYRRVLSLDQTRRGMTNQPTNDLERAAFDVTGILVIEDGDEEETTEHVVETAVGASGLVPAHTDLHTIAVEHGAATLNPCCTDLVAGRFVFVAKRINPQRDRLFGKPSGYLVWTPVGIDLGNVAKLAGEIAWQLYVKWAGAPQPLFNHVTFFQPAIYAGGTYEPTYVNFGYFPDQFSLEELLGRLYFENGLVETVKQGKIGIRKFSPFAPASAASFAITPRNSNGFKLLGKRWASPFFNVFTFISAGHPMDRAFSPFTTVTASDPAGIAFYGKEIPHTYNGLWLDGASQEGNPNVGRPAFEARASEIVTLHAAAQRSFQVTINAATEDAPAATALSPGDYVTLTWGPEDPDIGPVRAVFPLIAEDIPEVALVLGVRKSMRLRTITLTGLRLTGGGSSPGYARYTDGAPMFPASLSGEAGYGGGSAAVWNPAWSLVLKAYAKANFAYYGDDDEYILLADPDSYLGSRYS